MESVFSLTSQNHVISLKQEGYLQIIINHKKISISLWAINLIPLDVIFVIIIYEGATSNQIPYITTSDVPL